MRTLFLPFLLLSFVFWSCKKEEEVDTTPAACFTTPTSNISTHQLISFTNCSEGSVYFEWDFGDGTNATVKNPTHKYDVMGNYKVKLTAYSQSMKKTAEKTMEITVNDKMLYRIVIKKMPFKNNNNESWDEEDGPDIICRFKEAAAGTTNIFEAPEFTDVTENMLPLTIDVPAMVVNSNVWHLTFTDHDDVGVEEFMQQFLLKPTEVENIYTITDASKQWEVVLQFIN